MGSQHFAIWFSTQRRTNFMRPTKSFQFQPPEQNSQLVINHLTDTPNKMIKAFTAETCLIVYLMKLKWQCWSGCCTLLNFFSEFRTFFNLSQMVMFLNFKPILKKIERCYLLLLFLLCKWKDNGLQICGWLWPVSWLNIHEFGA